MKVIIPKTSGFCPGVKRAEDSVFKLRKEADYVNLHGPLIHNQNYIDMLQENNIKSVSTEELQQGQTLVIRTHGISRHEEDKLAQKFVLKDLTCPIVKRVQKHVENASMQGAFLVISGKANHAEVQGLVSYADHFCVIENTRELDEFLNEYRMRVPKDCSKIYILSQTTHSRSFFETLCNQIQQTIQDLPVEIKDTICPVTENKENESLQLQKNVDFTIVIGDPTSSNSKKLYSVLKNASDKTIFTSNLAHLNSLKTDWSGIESVLLVSSTSTPIFIEKEIADYLENL